MNDIAHAERAHAPLSPSKAEQWLSCPGWMGIAADLPGTPAGKAAQWGTKAHEWAERAIIAAAPDAPTLEIVPAEFHTVLRPYLSAVASYIEFGYAIHPEVKVSLDDEVLYGTADAVIVGPNHLIVLDLKTGDGHIVDPKHNPQLGVYALAAVRLAWAKGWLPSMIMPQVTLGIAQAAQSNDVVEWRAPHKWLMDLGRRCEDAIARYKARAAKPATQFVRGDHCTWCPAKAVCPSQRKLAASHFPLDTPTAPPPVPAALTPEALAQVLEAAPKIREWLKAVELHCMAKPPPGWKTVSAGSRRAWGPDRDAILQWAMSESLVVEKDEPPPLLPLGAVEKALGKGQKIPAHLTTKTEGKPSLVPESDPRPSLAAGAFPAED